MKIIIFKKRTIKKMLALLGFGSSAFVFAACYGPLPEKYREREYADSIRTVFEKSDSLAVKVPAANMTDSIK